MNALLQILALVLGAVGFFVLQGIPSIVMLCASVLLGLVSVGRYIANINGHDPWAGLRREHRRQRARR